eukprot:c35398_g1_i1 orf=3-272(-)
MVFGHRSYTQYNRNTNSAPQLSTTLTHIRNGHGERELKPYLWRPIGAAMVRNFYDDVKMEEEKQGHGNKECRGNGEQWNNGESFSPLNAS